MWRFYVALAQTAFRRQLIYRWANLAGICTNIFFVLLFSYILIALYQVRPVVAGYNLQDMVRYTWLVQAMIMVVVPFNWNELMLTIRSGEVVSDLSKPCDFYGYWFSREVGRSLYYLLFRSIPIYLVGMVLFKLGLPDSWFFWLAYAFSFSIGTMLGIAYRFLFNLAAFWLVEARAMITLATTVSLFFTGSYIPIPLLSPPFQAIVGWLPFNGLMNLPVEIFLGKIVGFALLFELGRQLLWLVILMVFARWLTGLATQRVVSQGG
ncbi:ABC transporter permease [Tengunoibacter tsumagoiensis]|uniref:ABC transporter permease n=1 Tax=Tengunoibacter tsumagoiensis TaxID=2014871 RepID=A0A402A0K0_9CHLR|nr:ABC-2 family transporter protein [Tengunoibacter tsumagoiensis]GCE12677.1 ABC transporter permease [Tengunoibacter tsumagoiensis]